MKPFTLSRRRVLLILANYFAGYLFVYPMLIGLLYSLLEPLGVKNLQAILENAVYLWVFAITVTAAWPLLKEHLQRFRRNRRNIIKSSLTHYVQMWLIMYGLNLAIILITGLSSSQNQDTVVQQLTQSPLQIVLVTCVFAPIVEETVFRGAVFATLRNCTSFRNAAWVSGFLFGLLHVFTSLLSGNLSDGIFILVYGTMGYLLCAAEEENQTLISPLFMHGLNNLISVVLILL